MGDGFSRGPYRPYSQRMCVIEGCPNPSLETKDTCAGHVGGNVAVPEPTAPRPSDAAMHAAQALLMVPNTLGRIATGIGEVSKHMNSLCEDLERLVESLKTPEGYKIQLPKVVKEGQTPRVFFLNEAHETHVTKAQARKERRDALAKKREAKGKATRVSRVVRKPRSRRTRRS